MDLKLRHIYRNAFIFAILGLPRNILITLILVAMVVGTLYCPGGRAFARSIAQRTRNAAKDAV